MKVVARMGKARIPLQVDIGYGDTVTPPPILAPLPAILNFPAPHLKMYPKEAVVAEKFEAMISLDMLNSRMKDFFDVWILARSFEFHGPPLADAVKSTFARRGVALPMDPLQHFLRCSVKTQTS